MLRKHLFALSLICPARKLVTLRARSREALGEVPRQYTTSLQSESVDADSFGLPRFWNQGTAFNKRMYE